MYTSLGSSGLHTRASAASCLSSTLLLRPFAPRLLLPLSSCCSHVLLLLLFLLLLPTRRAGTAAAAAASSSSTSSSPRGLSSCRLAARARARRPPLYRSSSSSGRGTADAFCSSSSYCATVDWSMVTSGGLSAGDSTKERLGSPTSFRASQRKGFSKL